jgi:SOS response regulatory protein OraA/RecX
VRSHLRRVGALATLSIKARALRLLAQREHSRAEGLERKLTVASEASRCESRPALALAGSTPKTAQRDNERLQADLTQALDDLQHHGLISDARTADALLLSKAPRYGTRRLKQMLQAKSLDADLVATHWRVHATPNWIAREASGSAASAHPRPTCANAHGSSASWRRVASRPRSSNVC